MSPQMIEYLVSTINHLASPSVSHQPVHLRPRRRALSFRWTHSQPQQ